MKKYITTEQAEFILTIDHLETKSIQCNCGQSYAIITDDTDLIVCDACHDSVENIDRQF